MTLFFDHLLSLSKVEEQIKTLTLSFSEREEVTKLIDTIVNNHMVTVILNHLPHEKHHEFLNLVTEKPYSPEVLQYLKSIVVVDIEEVLQSESAVLAGELLKIVSSVA